MVRMRASLTGMQLITPLELFIIDSTQVKLPAYCQQWKWLCKRGGPYVCSREFKRLLLCVHIYPSLKIKQHSFIQQVGDEKVRERFFVDFIASLAPLAQVVQIILLRFHFGNNS